MDTLRRTRSRWIHRGEHPAPPTGSTPDHHHLLTKPTVMSTTAHPTHRPPAPGEPAGTGAEPRTGPIRRIIAGSLVTGLVPPPSSPWSCSAARPSTPSPGRRCSASRLGWAMLAVLSTRLTSQPQRWAWVPAAAMAVTGLGLLVLAPDDAALTAAGWVWPPAAAGARRLDRASACAAPWPPAAAAGCSTRSWRVMAAAAVGGAVETVALASDQRSYAMPGQLLRRRRPPAAPALHRLRRPHRRADRAGWVGSPPLGPHRPGRRRHHPGLRLRPRRAGLERRRAATPGRPAGRRRSARPARAAPARTARTCWSGTPSAATTR